MSNLLARFEYVYTVIALALYSNGFIMVVLTDGFSEGNEGVPPAIPDIPKMLFFVTYFICAALLTMRWKNTLYILSKDLLIFPLVGLVFVSVLWSTVPNDTMVRGIAFFGTTLFGLYLATRYTLKQQLQLVGWAFALIIFFSFVYAFIFPQYGVENGIHAGSWRGVFVHKNIFGRYMILSSAVFCSLFSSFKKHRLFTGLGIILSIILLILAGSTSAIVSLLVVLSAFFICNALHYNYYIRMILLSTVVIIGCSISAWLNQNPNALADLTGKDLSLTGRTDFWPLLFEKISQQFWLGYGYEGFWQGWSSEAADIWYAVRWEVPNSHNGLMDLWLQLGFVGVLLFLAGYLIYFAKFLNQFKNSAKPELVWPILFFVCMLLFNITESTLMSRNTMPWVLYVSMTLSTLMPDHRQLYRDNQKLDRPTKILV